MLQSISIAKFTVIDMISPLKVGRKLVFLYRLSIDGRELDPRSETEEMTLYMIMELWKIRSN